MNKFPMAVFLKYLQRKKERKKERKEKDPKTVAQEYLQF
jgi:hypothetical protein